MASLTRYTPFDGAFDGLFRSILAHPSAFDAEPALKVRMDVAEDEAAYTVHAEIPGVKKEDINVTIDGNQVAITAEVRQSREEKQGERLLRSERYQGKVYRAFSLAQEVDQAASEARYTDGVLELRLPKKAAVSAKKLSIQ